MAAVAVSIETDSMVCHDALIDIHFCSDIYSEFVGLSFQFLNLLDSYGGTLAKWSLNCKVVFSFLLGWCSFYFEDVIRKETCCIVQFLFNKILIHQKKKKKPNLSKIMLIKESRENKWLCIARVIGVLRVPKF